MFTACAPRHEARTRIHRLSFSIFCAVRASLDRAHAHPPSKDELKAGPRPQLAAALSRALLYAHRLRSASAAGPSADHDDEPRSRILALMGSPDVPSQHVAVMNAIFAAKRSGVMIDACMLGHSSSSFLQQAADITGGTYLKPQVPTNLVATSAHTHILRSCSFSLVTKPHFSQRPIRLSPALFLPLNPSTPVPPLPFSPPQYLRALTTYNPRPLLPFSPPQYPRALATYLLERFSSGPAARPLLKDVIPGAEEAAQGGRVDLQASCFCHKRRVSRGWVCSVCLSIFCETRPRCPTCQAEFLAGERAGKRKAGKGDDGRVAKMAATEPTGAA